LNETGYGSWNGTRVRRGDREGTVVNDDNFLWRILTVKMDDGSTEQIKMHNIHEDPPEVHEWEWYTDKFADDSRPAKWIRF
jgi:hypothetical protein